MDDILHQWVKAYHKCGWCVLPARNKIPLVSWKEYQNERPTKSQVTEWFSDAPDDAQIALVTGKVSSVTVIDIDKHSEECDKTDDCECVDVDDLLNAFDMSMTSITGSGGYHLFCEYDSSIGNSVRVAHPQLDIRSDGGIIILPPSPHNSGNMYDWSDMVPFNPDNLKNIAPFPQKLKKYLEEKPKNDWGDITSGLGEGRRNDSLAALTGKIVGVFGKDDLEPVYNLLWAWNKQYNEPPLSKHEFDRTFESIVKKHINSKAYRGYAK